MTIKTLVTAKLPKCTNDGIVQPCSQRLTWYLSACARLQLCIWRYGHIKGGKIMLTISQKTMKQFTQKDHAAIEYVLYETSGALVATDGVQLVKITSSRLKHYLKTSYYRWNVFQIKQDTQQT
ncbi:MAG: hypothetical protein ACRCX2_18955 [Paraclostridium sp.]